MAIKCTINESVGQITWAATNGDEVTLHLERVSDAVKAYAVLHGLKQRGSDVMALSRDTATGASATEEDKFNELRAIVAWYESGTSEWSRRPAAGQRFAGDNAILAECLKRLGKDATKVSGMSRAEVAALLTHPKIRPLADEIRAEKAGNVDAEALLAGL